MKEIDPESFLAFLTITIISVLIVCLIKGLL